MPTLMQAPAKTILVGIDEAGYGPILGPLVVSATAWEVPTDRAEDCLWQTLRRSVSQTASGRQARIAILDSKQLFRRKNGLAPLERSVLAVLAAWCGRQPAMTPLLDALCPEAPAKLAEYPWYRDVNPTLPRSADAAAIRIAASLLNSDMADHSVRIAGCWSEILPEGHYNRLIDQTKNKSVALYGLVLRLIHRIGGAFPRHGLRIMVDKLGAKSHYGPGLMRAFEDRHLRVIAEDQDHSAYEMVTGPSSWRVSFTRSGDSRYMPVAMASLISKYLREILMGCFNAYWSRHVADLKPTAGYYQDGLRFLGDIRDHARRMNVGRDILIRQR